MKSQLVKKQNHPDQLFMKEIPYVFILMLICCAGEILGQGSDCDSFLLKNLHPFYTENPEKGAQAFGNLASMIGDSRLVALGAATEGSHQEFVVKRKLIEHLVEEMNFRTLILNTGVAETKELNQYLLAGEGRAKIALRSLRSRLLYTEEMMELLNFIRDFNNNSLEKIQVVGIDMLEYKQALENLDEFVGTYAPNLRASMDLILEEYDLEDNFRNYNRLQQQADFLFKNISESKYKQLRTVDYEWILYNAKVISQNASYLLDNRSALVHDQCLAENVSWVIDRLLPGRAILWSHNNQIDQMPFYAMGSILHDKYGADYYTIGFAAHSGTYAGFLEDNTLSQENRLEFPNDKCYEYKLKALGTDFLLNLTDAPKSGCKWLTSRMKFREVNPALGGKEFVKSFLTDSYDSLIFIEKSEATKLMAY